MSINNILFPALILSRYDLIPALHIHDLNLPKAYAALQIAGNPAFAIAWPFFHASRKYTDILHHLPLSRNIQRCLSKALETSTVTVSCVVPA